MIKLISKENKDGIHEQIWMLTILNPEPITIFKVIRNKDQYSVDKEAISERSQILLSSIGKYISLETSNGLGKSFSDNEATERLTKMYEHLQENRMNIKYIAETILKMETVLKVIAREGSQYILYKVIMQMTKEQLDYEIENNKI